MVKSGIEQARMFCRDYESFSCPHLNLAQRRTQVLHVLTPGNPSLGLLEEKLAVEEALQRVKVLTCKRLCCLDRFRFSEASERFVPTAGLVQGIAQNNACYQASGNVIAPGSQVDRLLGIA